MVDPVKIRVFPVPAHLEFRPNGRPVRINKHSRSRAASQQAWLKEQRKIPTTPGDDDDNQAY